MNDSYTFIDKRKRTWEVFEDRNYYDMTCVRCLDTKNARDFNSELSFHFATSKKAEEFVELLKNCF